MVRTCKVRKMRNAEAGRLISRGSLGVVTGERLEIERLTSRSEEGRWKSTHRGNSLAAYPTSRPVLRRGSGSNPASLAGSVSLLIEIPRR